MVSEVCDVYGGTFLPFPCILPQCQLNLMTASTGQQHTKHPTSLSQNARGFKGPVVNSSEFYKRFGESVESDGCSTNFASCRGGESGSGRGKAGKGTRRVLVVGRGKSAQEYLVCPWLQLNPSLFF